MAVSVFNSSIIQGNVVMKDSANGVRINATFTTLPEGKHGFHIHKAGDLRGVGCMGLCEHYDVGNHTHGDAPYSRRERHTGDLGNIEIPEGSNSLTTSYFLRGISVKDLWGRSLIIHEFEDDLGLGGHEDSHTTGNSGARIGCAIIGRISCHKTRKAVRKI